jgi:hypothetical protein
MILIWFTTEDSLPDDGIEVLTWSNQESNHYSPENEGHFELAFREGGDWFTAEEGVMLDRNIDLWTYIHSPAH